MAISTAQWPQIQTIMASNQQQFTKETHLNHRMVSRRRIINEKQAKWSKSVAYVWEVKQPHKQLQYDAEKAVKLIWSKVDYKLLDSIELGEKYRGIVA